MVRCNFYSAWTFEESRDAALLHLLRAEKMSAAMAYRNYLMKELVRTH
jgi:hypothetical protein